MPRTFTEAEREAFLADTHVGVLSVATNRARPPASVPIWYDYTPGGNIRVNTGSSSRKAKLIEQAGAVTLVVQRDEVPYRYVVVEGTVVDTTIPSPMSEREAIAARYLGADAGREFARQMDGYTSVLFTIRPDRWFTADFSDEF
ncbi:pyridoxamine 5'-phosphate oxidase family protein [Rhodococcus sp. NPDC058521]|uniref:pyridoxamine 5'-phosphate oxidase family protein n=1 Tax=Rhodococcus sp. NPDC058521 TaxID=3346536 RepID=UPI00366229BA